MTLRPRIAGTLWTLVAVAMSAGAFTRSAQDGRYDTRATEFCATRRLAEPTPSTSTASGAGAATSGKRRDSIGLTLYRRAADGTAHRVDPATKFEDGDAIRLVVESNFDGSLYIFNSDSSGTKPVLVYPQVRLGQGLNRVSAHVPTEIPSRTEANAANQWLVLSGGPVTDRLTVIVAATPLSWVPVGSELVRWCGASRDCYWTPESAAAAASLRALEERPDASVASNTTRDQAITERENEAIARTIRLAPDAPPPDAILMARTPTDRIVVGVLDLVHTTRRSK